MKSIKKITAAVTAAALAFGAFGINAGAQQTETDNTAIISVEAFSIGCGYVVEPTKVSFEPGDTVDKALIKLFEQKNISYEAATGGGFYLESVSFAHAENIPSYITDAVVGYDDELCEDVLFSEYIDEGSPDSLGQYDYTALSGWMFTVNKPDAESMQLSMSQTELKPGDVIRLQFSLDCGADVGLADLMGMPMWGFDSDFYSVSDKTELTRAIACANEEKFTPGYNAYIKMIRTAENIPADQKETDSALEAYNALKDSAASIGDIDNNGRVTVADAIMIQKHIADIERLDAAGQCIADFNSDEEINVSDAIDVQKMIAGISA